MQRAAACSILVTPAGAGTIRRVINFDGPVPIWRQIEAVLRERIADGTYPPGHAIPSLVKLTAEFGVAEVTVRKAVDKLKRDGVLSGTSGRGTYVTGS